MAADDYRNQQRQGGKQHHEIQLADSFNDCKKQN